MVAYNPTSTGVFWSASPDKPVRSLFDQTPCLKNKMKNNWKKTPSINLWHPDICTCNHTHVCTHVHERRGTHKEKGTRKCLKWCHIHCIGGRVFSLAQKWEKLSAVHCTSVQFITFHLCANTLGILTVSTGGWVGERMKREGNFSFNCG